MSEPRRVIGFWTAVSLVIGSMIGSGVFTLPAGLAQFGGVSLLGWTVTAFGSVMLALAFAHLARRNPAAGGVYAYTRDSFGPFAGFLVAWGYWISAWAANAAIAISFAGYAAPLLHRFFGLPDVQTTPMWGATLAIVTVWLLTAVNAAGVRAAGRVQVVTTILKITPLVIISVAGLFMFDTTRFAVPAEVSVGGSLFPVMALTLFAFLGLEAATIPADSVEKPEQTIPRATVVGTLATAVIYIASTAAVMSLVAPDILAKSTEPFADAARAFSGEGLAIAVGVGAAISTFGALNGWILVVSQLPMAIARDGLFPKVFARVDKQGTPIAGMIIAGFLATFLIYANYSGGALVTMYVKIGLLSTLATLIPYAFCSLAVFVEKGKRVAVEAKTAAVAALAFVYAGVAIYGAGKEIVFLGFLLLIAGLPVYVWVLSQRDTASR